MTGHGRNANGSSDAAHPASTSAYYTQWQSDLISGIFKHEKQKKIPPFIDKTAAMPFKICLKVEYFKKYTEYGQLHDKFWK